MNQPIHKQLREIRRDQHRLQKHVAAALGVNHATYGSWERGQASPFLHHTDIWATELHHQLVATVDGAVIDTLVNFVAALPVLRRGRGLTQEGLGRRTRRGVTAVHGVERQVQAGGGLLLSTVEWYVAGLDYGIGLAPAVLERAA
ncbi:helix-turn-helix transcriptional regulator [Nonomuraea sp. NPDC049709]|uniref:helix-turn-helix transcriptional regulator n=1 Tax=Nonomuraea sp. NPDC049709 TaxID=3154736 RepID=UPI0034344C47